MKLFQEDRIIVNIARLFLFVFWIQACTGDGCNFSGCNDSSDWYVGYECFETSGTSSSGEIRIPCGTGIGEACSEREATLQAQSQGLVPGGCLLTGIISGGNGCSCD